MTACSGAGDEPENPDVFECVINVSEGRDGGVIARLSSAAGGCLLDLHSDPDHHRSVLTIGGPADEVERAARRVATEAVASLDLTRHHGAHPRFGVLDVVPFVHLVASGAHGGSELADGPLEPALAARNRFAAWAAEALKLPCFVYGPERSLPEVRRLAWASLLPDTGPGSPHPTAGAAAVGARPALVAYNLWLSGGDLAAARAVAATIRGPHLRTLGLQVGAAVQVSCNLIAPWTVGPADVFDAVAGRVAVARAELVGLIPRGVLHAAPSRRWGELGLDPSMTIEARLEQAGLDGGRFGRAGR